MKRVTASLKIIRQADVIFELADRASRGGLKTKARFLDGYGGWSGVPHHLKDHPAIVAISVLGVLIGCAAAIRRLFFG